VGVLYTPTTDNPLARAPNAKVSSWVAKTRFWPVRSRQSRAEAR